MPHRTPSSGGSRPSDKGGGGGGGDGHPDPEIRRGSPKKFFSAHRASVWSKNKGGRGRVPRAPPLDPPLPSNNQEKHVCNDFSTKLNNDQIDKKISLCHTALTNILSFTLDKKGEYRFYFLHKASLRSFNVLHNYRRRERIEIVLQFTWN